MCASVCCIFCGEIKSSRGIHTHVERTHFGNPKYFSGNHGKYHLMSGVARDNYYKKPKRCVRCNIILEFEKKRNSYCGRSCAASMNNQGKKHSEETKEKLSKRKRELDKIARDSDPNYRFNRVCVVCGITFVSHVKLKTYLCSDRCKNQHGVETGVGYNEYIGYKTKKASKMSSYRTACNFRFNMADFKDEFDFDLIRTHGWYKPKNRGNNLGGVSRDHRYSIKDGFTNQVHPDIMSHPANCQLMVHNDNISKNHRSSVTLGQLLEDIVTWEEKYGTFTPCKNKYGIKRHRIT